MAKWVRVAAICIRVCTRTRVCPCAKRARRRCCCCCAQCGCWKTNNLAEGGIRAHKAAHGCLTVIRLKRANQIPDGCFAGRKKFLQSSDLLLLLLLKASDQSSRKGTMNVYARRSALRGKTVQAVKFAYQCTPCTQCVSGFTSDDNAQLALSFLERGTQRRYKIIVGLVDLTDSLRARRMLFLLVFDDQPNYLQYHSPQCCWCGSLWIETRTKQLQQLLMSHSLRTSRAAVSRGPNENSYVPPSIFVSHQCSVLQRLHSQNVLVANT